ncbi:MAG: heavy metal-binding domain-containing protein, partial [Salibacteraceae bacterium]
MKHTYKVVGMSCVGCQESVKNVLKNINGITKVEVDLQKSEAIIEMSTHITLEKLQQELLKGGLHYTIELPSDELGSHALDVKFSPVPQGNGVFYCPMHCEGEKTYDKPGNCPVCGMQLVEQPQVHVSGQQYTCPMHPEIIKNEPGSCSICGMDLVPLAPTESTEQKTYKELAKKMKIAVAFALPVFVISMSDLIPNNPLHNLASLQTWNWVQLILTIPVVFYACWMFFVRAWKSIITWNLNMFTLVGIGTGIAFLFSIVGLIFPDIFPNEFKTEDGTVLLYFEAAAVILTLVLLGQLLEARAHSQTSGAIKELLKMAPSE